MNKDFVIIFDLDGTLLDTNTLIWKSFEHVFHQYKKGYELSKEELVSFLGPSLKASLLRYFDEDMIEELIDYYRAFNHTHHEDYVELYPHVMETIHCLKEQGYPLAILTTKLKEAALIGLDMFQLTDDFDVIIGHQEVMNQKPHPEGIELIMKTCHCHRGIMIGDNVSDIMAGKNAGIHTVGVSWSLKRDELVKVKPDMMIDDLSELIDIVERVK